MRTIHVLRSGRNYFIDGIYWGDDEEGVILYLRPKLGIVSRPNLLS